LCVQGHSYCEAAEVSPFLSNGSPINNEPSVTVSAIVVPKFSDSPSGASTFLHVLREKCDAAKILGLVRCEKTEFLLVYDGQYIFTSLFVLLFIISF
jgi:hypothetical protein